MWVAWLFNVQMQIVLLDYWKAISMSLDTSISLLGHTIDSEHQNPMPHTLNTYKFSNTTMWIDSIM